MSENFRKWVRERLLASKKFAPEQVDVFMSYIDPPPEDKTGATLNQLIAEKKLAKGLVVLSRHPRNVFLNLKGIFTGSVATLIGIGGGIAPWAAVLLALVAVVQFMDDMSIELSQDHAEVVLWLWEKCQSSSVSKSVLGSAVAGKLNRLSLEQVLDDLEKLRAVEVEDGSIQKIEYLVIKSSVGD